MPAGVDSGSTLRLSGRGAAGPRGGGRGDLYVHLRVADHGMHVARGFFTPLAEQTRIALAEALFTYERWHVLVSSRRDAMAHGSTTRSPATASVARFRGGTWRS